MVTSRYISTFTAACGAAAILSGALAPLAGAVVSGHDAANQPAAKSIVKVETYSSQKGTQNSSTPMVDSTMKDNPQGSGKKAVCTGTLISPEWVLSAKHCLGGDGAYSTISFSAETEPVDVDSTITHDKWDLALLHLSGKNDTAPLPVWRSGTSATELTGNVFGFGGLDDGGNPVALDTLSMAAGKLNPHKETENMFPGMPTQRVTLDHAQTARGDSGAPFVVKGQLYGVLSQGVVSEDGNENATATSLFVPVGEFSQWLNDSVGEQVVKPVEKQPARNNAQPAHKKSDVKHAKKGHKNSNKVSSSHSHASAMAVGGQGASTSRATSGENSSSFAHAGTTKDPHTQSLLQKMLAKVRK